MNQVVVRYDVLYYFYLKKVEVQIALFDAGFCGEHYCWLLIDVFVFSQFRLRAPILEPARWSRILSLCHKLERVCLSIFGLILIMQMIL